MLTFAILFNLLLAALNCYLAFRLWELRRWLARLAETLVRVEGRLQRIFHPAPALVLQGQGGTRVLRENYRKLEEQLEKLQQILRWVNLGVRIWQRQSSPPQKRPRKLTGERLYNLEGQPIQ